MIRNLQGLIYQHIRSNLLSYGLLFAVFIAGVAAGAFTVNALGVSQKLELASYFRGFMDLFSAQDVDKSLLFNRSLMDNFRVFILIWFLGAVIIGIPFIFIVIGIKGFITGFSVGFVINCLGISGILFSFSTIFLKDILIVPSMIAMAVFGINFSSMLLRSRHKKVTGSENMKMQLLGYFSISLVFGSIILVGVLCESFLSPELLKIILPLFIG